MGRCGQPTRPVMVISVERPDGPLTGEMVATYGQSQSGPRVGDVHTHVPFPVKPSKHRPVLHGDDNDPGHAIILQNHHIIKKKKKRPMNERSKRIKIAFCMFVCVCVRVCVCVCVCGCDCGWLIT
jgi:hypothetical protein